MVFKPKPKAAPNPVSNGNKKDPKKRPHLEATYIKPGQVLNPAGRPKGSRNKLGEAFLADLLADWEEYGAFALADCRKEDPSAYCRIVASILPKEINFNDEESILEKFLDQFTTVEEIQAFRALLAKDAGGTSQAGQSVQPKRITAANRSKPNGVH